MLITLIALPEPESFWNRIEFFKCMPTFSVEFAGSMWGGRSDSLNNNINSGQYCGLVKEEYLVAQLFTAYMTPMQ